jgi:hypothetical protein
MRLDPDTAYAYLDDVFTQMVTVAGRLGDDLVNRRPLGPQTNAVAPLVVHCCGVTEHWLGHIVLDRPSHRDRDAEFEASATVAELQALLTATLAQARADLDAIERGESVPGNPRRTEVPGGEVSDLAVSDTCVVLHVLTELFQHVGHMELAADALLPVD